VLLVCPDVVVTVLCVYACAGIQEPWVLRRGVVDDKINDHLYATSVGLVDEVFKVVERAVIGMDRIVVGYIIFMVARRTANGHEPDGSDAKLLQVVQFCSHPIDVANAIAIGVGKGVNKNLVEDCLGVGQFCL